jgi:hypothetical protein
MIGPMMAFFWAKALIERQLSTESMAFDAPELN